MGRAPPACFRRNAATLSPPPADSPGGGHQTPPTDEGLPELGRHAGGVARHVRLGDVMQGEALRPEQVVAAGVRRPVGEAGVVQVAVDLGPDSAFAPEGTPTRQNTKST